MTYHPGHRRSGRRFSTRSTPDETVEAPTAEGTVILEVEDRRQFG